MNVSVNANANINMNGNNLQGSNLQGNNVQGNKVQTNELENNSSIKNADKDTFLNLFKLLSTNNKAAEITDINNENIMEVLLGCDENGSVKLVDETICLSDGVSSFKVLEKDEKQNSENMNSDIINIGNGFNYLNTVVENLDTSPIETSNSDVYTYYKNNIRNIISVAGYSKQENSNGTMKENMSNITSKLNELINNPLNENMKTASSLVEKSWQADSDKSKIKDNFSYEVGLTDNSEKILENDNKVIEISDESSQIKSSVLSQVKDKIIFMTNDENQGTKHVTMELNPDNLGKIDIKMTFQNNEITVEVKALNEETQKILSSNAEELVKMLNKTADKTVNVTVRTNESQYMENSSEHHGQNNGQGRENNNNYYYSKKSEDTQEDSIFSQIINLRDLKLNNAV